MGAQGYSHGLAHAWLGFESELGFRIMVNIRVRIMIRVRVRLRSGFRC